VTVALRCLFEASIAICRHVVEGWQAFREHLLVFSSVTQCNWGVGPVGSKTAMARIILAEDDDSMRSYLVRALERAGVASEVLGDPARVAVLSGPNHAEEVARDLPTASVLASCDAELARCLQGVLADRELLLMHRPRYGPVNVCKPPATGFVPLPDFRWGIGAVFCHGSSFSAVRIVVCDATWQLASGRRPDSRNHANPGMPCARRLTWC
jgi:hypothetical protein